MTTLGLLSDTHGRADTAELGVQLLIDHGADVLIHLGDVGSVGVIDALAAVHPRTGEPVAVHLVFGNTDWEARSLGKYAAGLGMRVYDPAGQIEVDGRSIAFSHGHLGAVMQRLLADEPDYLLHGHTHTLIDERQGRTRVINPGALFRASRHTVALLEPGSDTLTVVDLASVAR